MPPAPGITASLLQELSAQKNETAGLKQQLETAQALLSRAETRASEAVHEHEKLRGAVAAMRTEGCSDQELLSQLTFSEDQVLSLKAQLCDVECEKGVAEQCAATLQERYNLCNATLGHSRAQVHVLIALVTRRLRA